MARTGLNVARPHRDSATLTNLHWFDTGDIQPIWLSRRDRMRVYGNKDATNGIYISTQYGLPGTWAGPYGGTSAFGTAYIRAIRELNDGEILVATNRQGFGNRLYRSTGWASNPTTATFAVVLTPSGQVDGGDHSNYIVGDFGIQVYGSTIMVNEYGKQAGYGIPGARYAWISLDMAHTFTLVWDLHRGGTHVADIAGQLTADVVLPVTTLPVDNAAQMVAAMTNASAGNPSGALTVMVGTGANRQTISCSTGGSAGQFTGCTGGTGVFAKGSPVQAIDGAPGQHIHSSAYDPWRDMLWVTHGDQGSHTRYATNWRAALSGAPAYDPTIPGPHTPADIAWSAIPGNQPVFGGVGGQEGTTQYAGVIPFPDRIVLASDGQLNGLGAIEASENWQTLRRAHNMDYAPTTALAWLTGAIYRPDPITDGLSPVLIPWKAGSATAVQPLLVASNPDGSRFHEIWRDTLYHGNSPSYGLQNAIGPTADGKIIGNLLDAGQFSGRSAGSYAMFVADCPNWLWD